ncbi:hypothetical protein EWM64_g7658 [Hericium alpestre]|uniref:MRG domain-containing protein n=1 Tax=Hericium alpestre TaxID=135208 RepID=A0A4Y9ZQ11_9AGAM|nr:hypothetical protein EWM64_g7658 [Hericium alpestre]
MFLPMVIVGLQTYFNRVLSANLLYRFERLQYAEIHKHFAAGLTVKVSEKMETSTVYGAEHLLHVIGACMFAWAWADGWLMLL